MNVPPFDVVLLPVVTETGSASESTERDARTATATSSSYLSPSEVTRTIFLLTDLSKGQLLKPVEILPYARAVMHRARV